MKFGFEKIVQIFKVVNTFDLIFVFGLSKGMGESSCCFFESKTLTTMNKFEMWGEHLMQIQGLRVDNLLE